jgi:alpha-galactosidase
MEIFGRPLGAGRIVRRFRAARLEAAVEKTPRGLAVRGAVSGRPGRVEIVRVPVPSRFLLNSWQSWGPMQPASPGDTFPELEAVFQTSPFGFSPLLGELKSRLWSDYFIAWDGGMLGFLASRIGHPFFIVEGAELVGYLEYFDAEFHDPVPLEPLVILRGEPLEVLLDRYASLVKRENRIRINPWNPVGWCSWYQYFGRLAWSDVLENLETAKSDRKAFPFELFQVDDGYETDIGDWLSRKPGYPDAAGLAAAITARGFRAGIWTAPFSASETSELFARHPDWMVAEDGKPKFCHRSWGKTIHALDLTNPEVLEQIGSVFSGLKRSGFDYFKIDFLFGSAMPGRRRDRATPIQAYRLGLKAIREAVGGSFVLGCGAPLLPSAGLVDGMRVGEDTAPHWKTRPSAFQGPNACFALENALMRQFMHGRFWLNDPDCLLLRSEDIDLSAKERELYALAAGALDNMVIVSDNLGLVADEGRGLLRRALSLRGGKAQVLGLLDGSVYRIVSRGGPAGDFTLAANLSDLPRNVNGAAVSPRSALFQTQHSRRPD